MKFADEINCLKNRDNDLKTCVPFLNNKAGEKIEDVGVIETYGTKTQAVHSSVYIDKMNKNDLPLRYVFERDKLLLKVKTYDVKKELGDL